MPIDKAKFSVFFAVSSEWNSEAQRLMGTIGLEFSLADFAFSKLYELCTQESVNNTDTWSIDPLSKYQLLIYARAFIDHTTRIQKILKAFSSKSDKLGKACESFFENSRGAFLLRDALHHVDSRISSGKEMKRQHPPHGDISWFLASQQPNCIDCFWVTFGPVAGDFASPAIDTQGNYKTCVDRISYRAHDQEANIGSTHTNLYTLMLVAQEHFSSILKQQSKTLQTLTGQTIADADLEGISMRMRLHGSIEDLGLR